MNKSSDNLLSILNCKRVLDVQIIALPPCTTVWNTAKHFLFILWDNTSPTSLPPTFSRPVVSLLTIYESDNRKTILNQK